mmetsp:Transcript_52784/g.107693  ORF Transcript_52784/g.107693 Transcript_52784/m.107693 type:complete len:83 (-) Transcript_52784:22-270(-)
MFANVAQWREMLDNFGPIARTSPAPYKIVDCEKMSEAGLTCNTVIQSSMEPPGNSNCDIWSGVMFQAPCKARPLETSATSST